jgi:hypothetical protein
LKNEKICKAMFGEVETNEPEDDGKLKVKVNGEEEKKE